MVLMKLKLKKTNKHRMLQHVVTVCVLSNGTDRVIRKFHFQ